MKFIALLLIAFIAISLQNTFNPNDSIKFWDYSRLSYCTPDNIKNVYCGPVCETYKRDLEGIEVIINTQTKNQAFVAYSKQEQSLVVVFRGSSNLNNWISDIDIKKVDYPKCPQCKIHDGFYKAYLSIQQQINSELQKLSLKYNTKNLIISGHSLGGALATVAAGELSDIYHIKKYYSYASPRVGTNLYSAWWNSIKMDNKYRITNQQDLVVHVPMIKFGFDHIDEEVWYFEKNSMNYRNCPNHEDDNCANSVHLLSASDHTTYLMRDTTQEDNNYKFKTCRGTSNDETEQFDEKTLQKIDEIQIEYQKEQLRKETIEEEKENMKEKKEYVQEKKEYLKEKLKQQDNNNILK